MEDLAIDLPSDLDTCHGLIRELLETLRQERLLIGNMQHQLERLLRQRFGRSSEKVDPGQLLLFAADILAEPDAIGATEPEPDPDADADADADSDADADAPPAPASAEKPRRKGHGRRPLPEHLPRR